MKLSDFIIENKNDSYYAYHDAAKKWSEDTGKPERDFGRAGVDVQDKYIEPEMKKRGLVPDSYIGAGATKYRREGVEVDEVAGPKDCWPGYKKDGTQPGTGKNKGKRVNKCVKEDDLEEEKDGMIGTPDRWYDEEERRDAWEDLQVAIDGARNQDEIEMIEDGVCPNCAGSGYQDGEYEVYNDETDDYEEGYECDGWGSYGCDEGEMQGATWKEIMAYDEQNVQRQQAKDNYPGDEEVIKQIASYMKHMDDPRLAYQQVQADYPHLGRAQRGELIGKASKLAFGESIEEANENNEAMVAKMLAKALGDDNRWTEMSPYELYSELESQNPEVADMLAKVAKQLYDVKLQERAYKDVGSVTNEAVKPTSIEDLENLHIRRYYVFEAREPSDPDMLQTSLISEKLPNEPMSSDMISELQDFVEDGPFGEYGRHVGNWNYDDSTMVRPGEVAIGTTEMEGGGTVLYTVVEKDAGMSDQLYPATPPRLPYDGNSPELHWNPKTNTWSELQERAYKDVGVADVHKDARGKEFKFDKDSKKFKSLDGEEADPKTKLGKDLMRQRRNAMKKSSPSYNKKTAPKKPSLISQIFGK